MEAGHTLGERVAYYRRSRGLLQPGLALRMNRSVSWVRKVESGARRVDSMSVVEELARALRLDPALLLEGRLQPPPAASPTNGDAKANAVREIGRLLRAYESFPVSGADEGICLDELRRQVAGLRRRYNTARNNLSSVVVDLPYAISAARLAVRRADRAGDRDAACALLADVLRLAAMEIRQYGDPELAWLAADRAVLAAERSGDAVLVAAAVGTLVHQMMSRGMHRDAVAVAIGAASTIAPATSSRVERWSVWGALHLFAGQAAARAGDGDYRSLLAVAGKAAAAVKVDRNDYQTFFGPTNVEIQRSGVLVDAGEPQQALDVGLPITVDHLVSVNRRTNHRIHLARAHLMLGHDDHAVAVIRDAEQVGPELVRTDPCSRDTIAMVLGRRRRAPSQDLRALAVRLGVIDG
jgi:transcriptional regulator with XRE-family HTH domain